MYPEPLSQSAFFNQTIYTTLGATFWALYFGCCAWPCTVGDVRNDVPLNGTEVNGTEAAHPRVTLAHNARPAVLAGTSAGGDQRWRQFDFPGRQASGTTKIPTRGDAESYGSIVTRLVTDTSRRLRFVLTSLHAKLSKAAPAPAAGRRPECWVRSGRPVPGIRASLHKAPPGNRSIPGKLDGLSGAAAKRVLPYTG